MSSLPCSASCYPRGRRDTKCRLFCRMIAKHGSELMKTRYTIVLSMAAGAVLCAVSVGGLYAQGKAPGAYVVIDISEIKDAEVFKSVLGRGGSLTPFGGHNVIASEKN